MITPIKPTSNKAISYSRFSSSQQHATSIHRQQELAAQYCKSQGLELVDTLADQGVSAFKGKNLTPDAALGNLLQLIQSGAIATPVHLIIESLDRLSRQAVNTVLPVFMNLINTGVTVHTLTDKQVYSAASIQGNWTQLIVSLAVMARAHDESLVKSERQKAYWNRIKAGGKAIGGCLPAWMEKTPNGIALHPERSQIVQDLVSRSIAGVGIRTIIKQLNDEGVQSFTRTGNWTSSYIALLLRNPALIGAYTGGRDKHKNPEQWKHEWYPALLDMDTWYKLQAGLKRNSKNKGSRTTDNYANLISGISFCTCGNPIHHSKTSNSRKDGTTSIHYYLRCKAAHREGSCAAGVFQRHHVERALFKALATRMLQTGYQAEEVQQVHQQQEQLQVQLESIHQQQARITEALALAPDVTVLASKLVELQTQADDVRTQQDKLQAVLVEIQQQQEIRSQIKTDVARKMLSQQGKRLFEDVFKKQPVTATL